jgi:hypothetical protein
VDPVVCAVLRSNVTTSMLKVSAPTPSASDFTPVCQTAVVSSWPLGTSPGIPMTVRVLRTCASVSLS